MVRAGGAEAGAAAGAVTAAGTAPGAPMRASGVPTGTVSPSPTRISSTAPSYGLGISVSTLSVETSTSASSNATVSPAALSQRPIVPSVTVSPSLGIVKTCAWSAIDDSRPPLDQPCSERPVRASMVSPTASERLGWGWMKAPTSAGSACQLTAR